MTRYHRTDPLEEFVLFSGAAEKIVNQLLYVIISNSLPTNITVSPCYYVGSLKSSVLSYYF